MQFKLFNEDGGKGGRLTGTITDDMLDSSKSVLESYRGRGTRGLQQFFSSPECAELAHKVFKEVAVIDLTAGNGALISKFTNRFGIEIDPDQAKSGYRAIVGDIQKVYPLLRQVVFKTDAIAINPPFGLQWNDAKYGSLNSTVLCYLYAVSLLSEFGQGVLIAGADRFDREILTRDEGNFYAVIECDDLFTDADIPSVMAFFTDKPCNDLVRWHSDKADLPIQADEVIKLRVKVKPYISGFTSDTHLEYMNELWDAIQHEYDRRYKQEQKHQYSIASKNNKIAVRLSAYDKLALQKDNKLSSVTLLNNQSVMYFALNQREWRNLIALEDDGLITIAPSLKDTVSEVLIEAEKQICPLYPIKPQQRLGFLEHLDFIECYQLDAEFTAGQSYPVSSQYTEPKLNKDGELVDVNKLKEWKVLEIKIGDHEFSESPQDIQYIIDHFKLSVLWRMLCSSIIRRRKEETGEPLVSRKLVPVICPLGEEQARMYSDWLSGFTEYFIATHNLPICDHPNLVERSSAILGQLWKLEFSSVLPEAEPDGYYPRGINWTPANLKVLELAMEHARSGDKVLIGSSLMAYGPWVADQLASAGVKAVHITEESNGKYQTKSPAKRANIVDRFRNDGANVLCASIHSMQLGHNLDTANVVILRGLPWDYSTFDQFIARVHRLTSKNPVTVYIVMSEGTVDIRKWELLNQKGAASQLALDGTLFHQDKEEINLQQILDELKRKGISADSTIPEEQIHQQWQSSAIKPIIPTNDMLTDNDWSTVDTTTAVQLTLF